MTEIKNLMTRRRTVGDLAVDGLFYGIVAGTVMGAFLVLVGMLAGESPITILGRFDPSSQAQPAAGALIHVATAAVYGAIFGIIWGSIVKRVHSAAAALSLGVGYGLILFTIAGVIILPGSRSPLTAVPTWEFAIAHVIYGLVLGGFVLRWGSWEKIPPIR